MNEQCRLITLEQWREYQELRKKNELLKEIIKSAYICPFATMMIYEKALEDCGIDPEELKKKMGA